MTIYIHALLEVAEQQMWNYSSYVKNNNKKKNNKNLNSRKGGQNIRCSILTPSALIPSRTCPIVKKGRGLVYYLVSEAPLKRNVIFASSLERLASCEELYIWLILIPTRSKKMGVGYVSPIRVDMPTNQPIKPTIS